VTSDKFQKTLDFSKTICSNVFISFGVEENSFYLIYYVLIVSSDRRAYTLLVMRNAERTG
jgi:hypothetical protein